MSNEHLLTDIHKALFSDLKETSSLWFYFCPKGVSTPQHVDTLFDELGRRSSHEPRVWSQAAWSSAWLSLACHSCDYRHTSLSPRGHCLNLDFVNGTGRMAGNASM